LTAPPAIDSPASWRVLAGCCIVGVFGVTSLYGSTFGLMMLPMQKELGWSRGDITFALTLMTLVGPAILPLLGWVIDHVRLRPLILWGVVLQSASLASFGFMHGSVWVYYGLSLVMVFTASGASVLTLSKLLQTWFDKALGRALGILFAVGAVGSVIHPQVARLVISHASWREAFMVMGAMSLVFGGLAAWLLLREVPPGAAPARGHTPAPAGDETARAASSPPVSMRAFLRDPVWWNLAVWNMLFGLAAAGTLVHFAALMQDRGLSLAQAATAMSLVGVGGFVGNLAAGWLIDHTSATRLARLFVLAPLGATAMLYFGSGVGVAIAAAVLLGMFNAGDHSLSMFLARRYFSSESFGRASATQQVATVFGSGTAPWLMGVVHDRTGSYDAAMMLAMGAFTLAAVAAWRLPEFRGGRALQPSTPGAGAATS
jgi:OFA family oxalate/formate antiporter-like MFS transporter